MLRVVLSLVALIGALPAVYAGAPKSLTDGGIGSDRSAYAGAGGGRVGDIHSVNALTGTGSSQDTSASGSTAVVDVTGTTENAIYDAGNSVFSYYPSVGHDPGDHQRAQKLIRFNSVQDGAISEVGLSIDGTINHGYMANYGHSTAYAAGQYILNSGLIYRALASCISASSGNGPIFTSGSGSDGTCSFTYQAHGQANAKMGLFTSLVAGPNAGNAWAGVYDLVLQNHWKQGFASGVEIDLQNNSGTICGLCQTLFLTGDAGTNPVGEFLSIYNDSTTNFYAANGVQVAGAKAVITASYADRASGANSYMDTGIHSTGILLNGTYSSAALAVLSDNAQLRFGGNSESNLNKWRIISNISGATDGALTFQHSTDNFSTNFTNPIVADGAGNVTIGETLSLTPTTIAQLPPCNIAGSGGLRYVTDAASPSFNGTLKGGGIVRVLALCNGKDWTAH